MPDAVYSNINLLFRSKGIAARSVDDTLEEGFFLDLNNCEELAENAMANRLGSILINRTGTVCNAMLGTVHSLAKLSINPTLAYRYAGTGTGLYRRVAFGQGPYQLISPTMSGQPWQAAFFTPTTFTSTPYIFIADANGMLKDNGTLIPPQQMGIFQPQFPVQAQVQPPFSFPLEPFFDAGSVYSQTGVTGFLTGQVVAPSTTLTSAVTATGVKTVTVAAVPNNIQTNQFVKVGTENVFVIELTPNGFTGLFTQVHAIGTAVQGIGVTGSVAASSTGTVTNQFGLKPFLGLQPPFQGADYVNLQLALSGVANLQQILLEFDCGDGTFTDYFYKVIAQGPLQSLLDTTSTPASSATDAAITNTLGVYGNTPEGVAQINPGDPSVTPFMLQLSDFAGAGRAALQDPVYNWQNVGAYRIIVVTNGGGAVGFKLYSMQLMGMWGPDVFAGVGYDYLFTFYNAADGSESNPCMSMTNPNPPLNTTWVYPRRSPVLLTMNLSTRRPQGPVQDGQITHVRIYRRGGTLGDNYRKIFEQLVNIAAGGTTQYFDTAADIDIQNNDIISFTNDVPVTSTLPNPVNTSLTGNVLASVFPGTSVIPMASVANVSVGQQISIGTPGATATSVAVNNFETVIVTSVSGTTVRGFVQNAHFPGEQVTATATYGQPVTIMTQAFGQMWFAGDPSNPHYLYWSAGNNPQAVSSAAYVPVGSPDDPITAIVQFKGNLYVSTQKFWWSISPGIPAGQQPTVFPTAAKHGCVAPLGYTVTEEAIFYQSIDGIRAFAGGDSTYLTQNLEFIFQGIGSSPIVEADPTQLSGTRMAYWNNMIYISYACLDGVRRRLILHTIYKRWRNDDIQTESLLLEVDTNLLTFGTLAGMVHIDRQNIATDERNIGGVLAIVNIAMALITPFSDQGMPAIQKSYQELTLDIDTNNAVLFVTLLFDDGAASFLVGTVQTTQRQKVNFQLNGGLGFEFYKVALQITCQTNQFVYLYQCGLKSLPLAKTRKSFDTFQLKFGTDESKIAKDLYVEYTSTTVVQFSVYYDGSATLGFPFTLPSTGGVRTSMRVRLPAISFRLFRLVGLATVDFQIWEDSRAQIKPLCAGRGYELMPFTPNG